MRIQISPSDGTPIYAQIVQQVRRLVAAGELKEGDELPSIRALAERLVVNPNTVARAYRELETAGIVLPSRGLGTYVTATDSVLAESEKQAILVERVDALLLESRQIGISVDDVVETIRRRHASFQADDEREVSRG